MAKLFSFILPFSVDAKYATQILDENFQFAVNAGADLGVCTTLYWLKSIFLHKDLSIDKIITRKKMVKKKRVMKAINPAENDLFFLWIWSRGPPWRKKNTIRLDATWTKHFFPNRPLWWNQSKVGKTAGSRPVRTTKTRSNRNVQTKHCGPIPPQLAHRHYAASHLFRPKYIIEWMWLSHSAAERYHLLNIKGAGGMEASPGLEWRTKHNDALPRAAWNLHLRKTPLREVIESSQDQANAVDQNRPNTI